MEKLTERSSPRTCQVVARGAVFHSGGRTTSRGASAAAAHLRHGGVTGARVDARHARGPGTRRHVHALDEDGGPAGGLAGHTWARRLHIDLLWVAESARDKEVGGEPVRRAEAVGRDRGCLHARVSTWDCQAPRFYEGQGYRVVAAVPDYPPGVTDFLLTKRLTCGG